MREQFEDYMVFLYHHVPTEIYEGLLSVFCLGAVLVFALFGIRRGFQHLALLLLVEYIGLVFCSTVFYRRVTEAVRCNFTPLWSYVAIQQEGKSELLIENIMNVAVFVPIGLLLGIAIRQIKWWQVLVIGCLVSMTIEALQYKLRCGFAETDDVIHNTLGCMIGYLAYHLLKPRTI